MLFNCMSRILLYFHKRHYDKAPLTSPPKSCDIIDTIKTY